MKISEGLRPSHEPAPGPENQRLAAWGFKRIADMSREDLIDALNECHRSYRDVVRANMQHQPVPLPVFNWTYDQGDAYMRELFETGMTPVHLKGERHDDDRAA